MKKRWSKIKREWKTNDGFVLAGPIVLIIAPGSLSWHEVASTWFLSFLDVAYFFFLLLFSAHAHDTQNSVNSLWIFSNRLWYYHGRWWWRSFPFQKIILCDETRILIDFYCLLFFPYIFPIPFASSVWFNYASSRTPKPVSCARHATATWTKF